MTDNINNIGDLAVLAFVLSIVIAILMMVGLLWIGWWVTQRHGSKCPYTKQPMRLCEDLAQSTVRDIQKYLARLNPIDNPLFEMHYSAFCPITGRVFSNCVNIFKVIRLDWTFLNKRYKGKWISWGSLSKAQQADIRSCHDTMEGFQTESSCPKLFPKEIDPVHALMKPGPLYVDLETKTLLGWKTVPQTTLELLIVQRPYYTIVKEDHGNF